MAKKILIIGQSFQRDNGGGITLSNLFEGWPREDIALAASHKSIMKSERHYCSNLFVLGKEEMWNIWPLSRFVTQYPSGTIKPANSKASANPAIPKSAGKLKGFLEKIIFGTLHLLGIYHASSKLRITNGFLDWFDNFGPDIVYTQLSTRELINFVSSLKEIRDFKLVIHIMDDWPSTIVKKGLLFGYWKNKIDREFKKLLGSADLFLTISESMKEEYLARYRKTSEAFHNPVDLEQYPANPSALLNKPLMKILYTGRIGTANRESLFKIADIIEHGQFSPQAQLHIYSPDSASFREKYRSYKKVMFCDPIKYEDVPALMAHFDVLLLPLDFSPKGIRFARYSMPTKATEYMASGVPVLVFASPETALVKHALKHKWACVISNPEHRIVSDKIAHFLIDEQARKEVAENAVAYAHSHFDKNIITLNFNNLLNSL